MDEAGTVDGAGPEDADAADADLDDGASSAPDPLAELTGQLGQRLEEAQRLLARQTDHVERLHEENQRLRHGELRSAQLPLVRDLLRLHDTLEKLILVAGDGAGDLRIVADGLLDALAHNGIVRIAPTAGDPFDAREHRAAAAIVTEDPDRHRTVAETAAAGFAWEDGTLIRPAEVQVFRHDQPDPAPAAGATTND